MPKIITFFEHERKSFDEIELNDYHINKLERLNKQLRSLIILSRIFFLCGTRIKSISCLTVTIS